MTIRAWQSMGIQHANEHGWYTKYDRSVLILEQVKHLIRIVAGRYHMSATRLQRSERQSPHPAV